MRGLRLELIDELRSEHDLIERVAGSLPGRLPSAEEDEARATGEELVHRYAPSSDDEAFGGDACIACPAYGVRCQGLEREWWTELEWEELPDHLPG